MLALSKLTLIHLERVMRLQIGRKTIEDGEPHQ